MTTIPNKKPTPTELTNDSFWSRLKSRWVLALFALPFAGVGIGLLWFAVIPTVVEGQQMNSWIEGSATLLSAGVNTHRGDDSTTYSAYATFRYSYGGQTYNGDRVAISMSADNIGEFNRDLGYQLERALKKNQTVPVYINPNNPAEATLNRDVRWGKVGFYFIFIVTFGGVGIGIWCYVLFSKSTKLPSHAGTVNKPWLENRDWASPEINSNTKLGMWVAWTFAAFWNCIAFPTGIIVSIEALKGNYIALVGLLFPVVGIGLVVYAIRTTLNWRRFGRTPLILDPYPGSIGGQVGGTIELGIRYDQSQLFNVTLQCVYSYMSGSGKNRSRKERVDWQSEGIAHTRPVLSSTLTTSSPTTGTLIEILFNVEAGLPQSDKRNGSSYHLWRLSITAEMDGIDFDRQFEIPVFATTESATALDKLSTEHHSALEQREAAIESVLNIQQVPGGIEMYYPAFRHPTGKIIASVFGLTFVAIGFAVYQHGASIMFPIVFGLIGGLIGLLSLNSLLTSLFVAIDRTSLRVEKRLLGIIVSRKKIPRDEIQTLMIDTSYSASSGTKHTTFYSIKAVTQHHGKITVGLNLAGKNVAEQALESVGMLTGLPYRDT